RISDIILKEETKKGFYGRLRQGIYPRPAPLGYRDRGKGLPKEIDPVQGPLVRKVFEWYATGNLGPEALAEKMHDLGLRNRKDGRVSVNGLSCVLHNPFYLGLIEVKLAGEVFRGAHTPNATELIQ